MTGLVTCKTEALPNGEPCFRIEMKAPRAKALEPGFLAELHGAFDALERSVAPKALLIGGRNFSSGGDVGRFHEAVKAGDAASYAEQVVPVLQSLLLRMIETPVIIASAMRGAVTGGASGLIFASDLVVTAPDAFMQPYYDVVGRARWRLDGASAGADRRGRRARLDNREPSPRGADAENLWVGSGHRQRSRSTRYHALERP